MWKDTDIETTKKLVRSSHQYRSEKQKAEYDDDKTNENEISNINNNNIDERLNVTVRKK